jgi:hypothetical protein
MKNTATNTLEYTGIVTISQYIGSKKVKLTQVHNEGGTALFNFLSDCLVGDFDLAKIVRPTTIMLLNYSNETDADGNIIGKSYTRASKFIHLLTKPEKVYTPSKGTVRYSFILTRDNLEGVNFNSIGLYTNAASELDPENFAAFCEVTNFNINDISSSAVLVVD